MKRKPLVSIIIPVFNAEKYINVCVESVIQQTYPNIEILLIDDGSADQSLYLCKKWRDRDSRIRVFHQNNSGVSSARNKGIKYANGEYIFFLDADDFINPVAISALIERIPKKQSAVAMLLFQRVEKDADLTSYKENYVHALLESSQRKIKNIKEVVTLRNGLFCPGILISKSLVLQNNIFFDENVSNLEDVVWSGLLFNYIDTVCVVKEELYYYRVTPNSITNKKREKNWQIKCWVIAYMSVSKLRIKSIARFRLQNHCLKNMYAECVSAGISIHEVSAITKRMRLEYLVYRGAFWCNSKLRRIKD